MKLKCLLCVIFLICYAEARAGELTADELAERVIVASVSVESTVVYDVEQVYHQENYTRNLSVIHREKNKKEYYWEVDITYEGKKDKPLKGIDAWDGNVRTQLLQRLGEPAFVSYFDVPFDHAWPHPMRLGNQNPMLRNILQTAQSKKVQLEKASEGKEYYKLIAETEEGGRAEMKVDPKTNLIQSCKIMAKGKLYYTAEAIWEVDQSGNHYVKDGVCVWYKDGQAWNTCIVQVLFFENTSHDDFKAYVTGPAWHYDHSSGVGWRTGFSDDLPMCGSSCTKQASCSKVDCKSATLDCGGYTGGNYLICEDSVSGECTDTPENSDCGFRKYCDQEEAGCSPASADCSCDQKVNKVTGCK